MLTIHIDPSHRSSYNLSSNFFTIQNLFKRRRKTRKICKDKVKDDDYDDDGNTLKIIGSGRIQP